MRSVQPVLASIVVGAFLGCSSSAEVPRGPLEIVLATGHPSGGGYYPLGQALAVMYNQNLAGVRVSVEPTSGSRFNVGAVNVGTADVAFALSEVAYIAYTQGTVGDPAPHSRLRGLALVYGSILHIAVRADSSIQTLGDLRGRRIGFGSTRMETSSRARYLDLLTVGGSIAPHELRGTRVDFDHMPQALAAGEIDAVVMASGYLVETLSRLAQEVDIRLLEIQPSETARIRTQYPFYRPAAIPAGIYEGQEAIVRTIAADNLLICRDGLPDEVVYSLTKTLFEDLSRLTAISDVAVQIDPEVAPLTSIPLHPGAARYYRERELLH